MRLLVLFTMGMVAVAALADEHTPTMRSSSLSSFGHFSAFSSQGVAQANRDQRSHQQKGSIENTSTADDIAYDTRPLSRDELKLNTSIGSR